MSDADSVCKRLNPSRGRAASRLIATAFVSALLLWAAWSEAAELQGRVVRVIDGDTLVVLTAENKQVKVRLAGIDAPERGQPYGEVSRRALAQIVAGELVAVRYTKHDRYGRVVGVVALRAEDVNLHQLTAGMAWHYKRYEHEQPSEERQQYSTAEAAARKNRIGIWSEGSPLPPWQWRQQQQQQQSGQTNAQPTALPR